MRRRCRLARAYTCERIGTCYPSWCAVVEAIEAEGVVVVSPVAHRVEDMGGA